MKTILFSILTIVFTFLLICFTPVKMFSQSQVNHKPTNKAKEMLCHKWNISTSLDSIAAFPDASLATIRFLPDGRVVFTADTQVEGNWNFDVSKDMLYLFVNNKVWKYTVLTLTNQQMVISNTRYKSVVRNYLWRQSL